MKTIKVGLDGLSPMEKVAKSLFIETKMTAAIANFPTPVPKIVDVKGAREALETAVADTLNGGKSATTAKDQAEALLDELLTQLAGYVLSIAGNNEAMILSSGFEVRRRGGPIGALSAPANMTAKFMDFPGRIEVHWDVVRGAYLYQLFINSTDPNDETGWKLVTMTTRTRNIVMDLITGKFYWFRTNAIGTAGESPMSDPAKSLAT